MAHPAAAERAAGRGPGGVRGRGRWGVAAACAATLALPAAPAPAATLRGTLSAWAAAHPATSAAVWRLDPAGAVPVAQYRPDTARLPASVMKLVTAAGALATMGPDHRFETSVFAGVNATQTGAVLQGPLYLVGSGDPMLSTTDFSRAVLDGAGTSLSRLAAPLRARGITLVRGPVVADESVYDAERDGPQWKAAYATESGPLSGLSVNQGVVAGGRGYVTNPPVASARRYLQALKAAGVRHVGAVREGRAPAQGRPLATVRSRPLAQIVAVMNRHSDNFIAETLAKATGAFATGEGSSAAGTGQTATALTDLGILAPSDALVDGSGLSRANRLTATTLVRLLATADADPIWGRALLDSLANGGEGTLRRRFRGAIAPRVAAKTGYINGVSTLAGVAESPSGVRYAFALLMNDFDITGARATQDAVVTLLAQGAADALQPLPSAVASTPPPATPVPPVAPPAGPPSVPPPAP